MHLLECHRMRAEQWRTGVRAESDAHALRSGSAERIPLLIRHLQRALYHKITEHTHTFAEDLVDRQRRNQSQSLLLHHIQVFIRNIRPMLDRIDAGLNTFDNAVAGNRMNGYLHMQSMRLMHDKLQLILVVHARSDVLQTGSSTSIHNLNPLAADALLYKERFLLANRNQKLILRIGNRTDRRNMTVHALDRRSARDHAAAFYISALDRPGRLYRKILRASHFTNRRHAFFRDSSTFCTLRRNA